MRRIDELRPLAPGTLERLCELLGLDPEATISLDVHPMRVLAVMLVDGRVTVVELVESS